MHSLTCGSVLRTLSAGLASKSKNAALVIDSLCWQSEDAMAFERFSPFAWTTQKKWTDVYDVSWRRLTFAKVDEYGSSKVAQMRGLMRCQQVRSPLWNSSSSPNFFMMSSTVGLSVSSSSPSRICSVSCVSRWVVYVIQQHGSTWHNASFLTKVHWSRQDTLTVPCTVCCDKVCKTRNYCCKPRYVGMYMWLCLYRSQRLSVCCITLLYCMLLIRFNIFF